jgi:hypothetical protein
MMKKLLLLISFITLGVHTQAQTQPGNSDFIVGTHVGISYDVLYTNKDINEYSPDMKTTDFSNLGYVSQYSLERVHSTCFQYGVKVNFARINAENEIELFHGYFTEFSLTSRYTFLNKPKLFNLYVAPSIGRVKFNSTRELVSDGGQLPLNSENGVSLKWDISFGIERNLSHNIICYAEATFNEVRDDGFDGWDYGTNVDKYNFYAIGFKFILPKMN